jgi:DNA-binding transcriptional regulator YdaS (Cro superfamily)
MDPLEAKDRLKRAIAEAGGPAAVGRLFKVSSQAVSQWQMCAPERVIALAGATEWRVSPHDIRPDLYPDPQDGMPRGPAAVGEVLQDWPDR